jgi:hypothetical protein
MPEWFNSQSTSGLDPRPWQSACPEGTYRIIFQDELKDLNAQAGGYLSSGLLDKTPFAFAVNSGPLFMIDFFRVDHDELDAQPFGCIVLSGSHTVSGGDVQHAQFSGRTLSSHSSPLQQAIAESGIASWQPVSGLLSKPAGPISELDPSVQAAFGKLASYMSGCLPPRSSN